MATEQSVKAIDGSILKIRAESICVHGDSPGAVAMATAVKSVLGEAGVAVGSFLPSV